jgi:hypothetical protein
MCDDVSSLVFSLLLRLAKHDYVQFHQEARQRPLDKSCLAGYVMVFQASSSPFSLGWSSDPQIIVADIF